MFTNSQFEYGQFIPIPMNVNVIMQETEAETAARRKWMEENGYECEEEEEKKEEEKKEEKKKEEKKKDDSDEILE